MFIINYYIQQKINHLKIIPLKIIENKNIKTKDKLNKMKDENDISTNLIKEDEVPIPLKEENNFIAPDGFIQSLKLSQENKNHNDEVLNFFCWFFSIVVWALIGLIVYYNLYEENEIRLKKCVISLIFYYLVYLILQYYSPTFKFLINKEEEKTFNEKMGEIFHMKPEVLLKIYEYHYDAKYYAYIDEDGYRVSGQGITKINTGDYSNSMNYKSFRDVSGLLVLNCGKSKNIRKAYVQLEIKLEINFADTISYADYEKEKSDFYSRNKHSDKYTQLNEEITVKGLKRHYLLKIIDKEPCTINIYFFIFFTIITLAQFYKIYLGTFCIHKKFTIRKIISTRYDLSDPEYGQNYEPMNPQISINNLKFGYEPNKYIYTNSFYNPEIPSQYELKNAKKFENKIPNYQIYKGINGAIVKDNPNFKNLNDNSGTPYDNENGFVSGKLNSADKVQRLSQLEDN